MKLLEYARIAVGEKSRLIASQKINSPCQITAERGECSSGSGGQQMNSRNEFGEKVYYGKLTGKGRIEKLFRCTSTFQLLLTVSERDVWFPNLLFAERCGLSKTKDGEYPSMESSQ